MRRADCRSWMAALLPALLALAALGGCRDTVDPWSPAPRPGQTAGDTTRLTYSLGDDRSPAWLGNDTVLYAGAGFDPYPIWPGVLLALPREGGSAELLLPAIHQSLQPKQYAAPVPAPSGDRIAYLSLDALGDTLCPYDVVYASYASGPVAAPPVAHLLAGRLFVRARSAVGPATSDPYVDIAFAGVALGVSSYFVRYLPFQRAYSEGQAIAFRPSWSPDGQKLVFSDGLRLLVWTVGQGEAVPLPGGEGGTSPAWSPQGDQIAFSRPVIVDSSTVTFTYVRGGRTSCNEQRTRYVQAASRLLLVPAAGGTVRDLGEGDEPAWTPDGSAIYARNWNDELVHVPAAGGTPVVVQGLRYANDFAISPDGNWLAFTRSATAGKHDVWVVRLSH